MIYSLSRVAPEEKSAKSWRQRIQEKVDNSVNEPSLFLASPRKSCRVLIVDDSFAIQKVMRRWLECSGCTVTIAENGKAGLALLKEQQFDITFMDFLMVRCNIVLQRA